MNIKINSIIIALALIAMAGQAQNKRAALPVFSAVNDSLKGFEETAAVNSIKHLSPDEFNVMMYRLKRLYINNKYNLKMYTGSALMQMAARAEAAAACTNEDFEQSPFGQITTLSQINGWLLTSGSNDPAINANANSCNLIGCCSGSPAQSELINASSGYIDPTIGSQYPIYSVFGQGSPNPLAAAANPQITQSMSGSKVIRLNNSTPDFSIEKLSKTFSVTSDNALFEFAYMYSGTGAHDCCDAGSLQFKLSNASTGSILACPNLSITAPSTPTFMSNGCNANPDTPELFYTFTSTTYTPSNNSISVYSKWKIQAIDLTPYIGQNVTLDFISTDCSAGGHHGYAYIDAQCGPMKMIINGNTSIFNSNTINLSSCEQTAMVTPPSNFSLYQWSGPSGTTLSSNGVLTTSTPGTYTLTMGQPGLCQTTKIVVINILSVSTTDALLCQGNSATLTATGLNSYIWNTGQTSSSIVVLPANTSVYTVSGITPNGYSCASSFVQNVVGPCTGINNYATEEKGIMIYPNPNNGEFTLNIKKQVKNAELLIENTFGQVLYTQPVLQGDTRVKTKNLPAGIYYYTVTENNKPLAKGKMQVN